MTVKEKHCLEFHSLGKATTLISLFRQSNDLSTIFKKKLQKYYHLEKQSGLLSLKYSNNMWLFVKKAYFGQSNNQQVLHC